MVNFLRNCITKISELTSPLRELLKKNNTFCWLPTPTAVLNEVKNIITKSPVLGIFDTKKEITIQTAASQNGLGSCIMQEGKPIAYASRSLTDFEKHYVQEEKELLAIVFAFRKFHFFVYGRAVNVQTDHQPLVSIFKKDIANIHSTRIQRMRMKLLMRILQICYQEILKKIK